MAPRSRIALTITGQDGAVTSAALTPTGPADLAMQTHTYRDAARALAALDGIARTKLVVTVDDAVVTTDVFRHR